MSLGKDGEDLVRRHYEKLGYSFLARNYIFPFGRQTGELDLIFKKEKQIVFVEVKTRRSQKFGSALESVDLSKQRKLVKTAKLYLLHNPKYKNWDYRIDVATVDIDNQQQPVIILTNAIEDLD